MEKDDFDVIVMFFVEEEMNVYEWVLVVCENFIVEYIKFLEVSFIRINY